MRAVSAFGSTVRQLRESQGLPRAVLANRSGLHVTEIYRIEAGERDPRLTTIVAVARGLGLTTSELVGRAYPFR
jgi:transcriptional regulator with XRE-family HTH domain